jgi:hypothetical protein
VILEDLSGGTCQGWQRDQLEGHTVAEARLVLVFAATLHRRYSNSLPAKGVHWLRPFKGSPEYIAYSVHQGQTGIVEVVEALRQFGYGGTDMGDTMRLFLDRMGEFYHCWRPVEEGGEVCSTLTHGDLRADNIFFTGSEASNDLRTIPIDYQLVHRAPGETDVAYFLSLSLTTEVRRSNEIALLTAYWAHLVTGNGSTSDGDVTAASYPFELCLANFQLALVYVSRTWLVGGTAMTDDSERGGLLLTANLARFFATFADWNTGPALRAMLARGSRQPTLVEEARDVLPARVLAAISRPKL